MATLLVTRDCAPLTLYTKSTWHSSRLSCRPISVARPKMHYCLQVTELLYYIFGWHATRSAGAQGSRTLYSLALTCRAFQQPALDILWEDMKGSLAPLIKCLPSDVWEKRPGEEILERGQLVQFLAIQFSFWLSISLL